MKLTVNENTRAIERYSHYEVAYIKLRKGIAALGILFPLFFLFSSLVLSRTTFQPSISAYYFTLDLERNLFVGILITVGIFLMLYEGYSKREDWVLKVAGVLACGIALFPTGTLGFTIAATKFTWHAICAVGFFFCIFYVCIFLSETTLSDLDDKDPAQKKKKDTYRTIYKVIAGFMIGPIVIAVLANLLPRPWLYNFFDGKLVFWVEATSIWSFALFWFFKTREVNGNIPWRSFDERNQYLFRLMSNRLTKHREFLSPDQPNRVSQTSVRRGA
jgi:hypothetical protein